MFPGADVVVDVHRFEQLAILALAVGAEPGVLDAAIDVHAGDLLPVDLYEDWTVARRQHLQARFHDLLPFFREQRHVGLARRVEVDAVAGEPEAVVANGERFEQDWIRAGRPTASNLSIAAFSIAVAHRMLGDDDEGTRWSGIAELLGASSGERRRTDVGWLPVLDGLALLHAGRADDAVDRLAVAPDDLTGWNNQYLAMCRPWYAAPWAEAAVLVGAPDARARLDRAEAVARTNPIAAGIVERGRALLDGDGEALVALAAGFAAAGCPYQERRTAQMG